MTLLCMVSHTVRSICTNQVGDTMSGTLKVTRNAVNPRELDLQLSWTATSSTASYKGQQDYKVC
jgi:hypothetical protein